MSTDRLFSDCRPRAGRAGLTLIELLIGILLTSIVVAGTYLMFGTSSEVFHHQELNAENQNNVRFAIEQLQRDIEHAGFNGSPNVAADPLVCPKPGFALPGIYIKPDVTVTTSSGSITFDQLIVVGDSSLTGPVPISSVTSSTITVDVTSASPAMSAAEFSASYAANKLVRLVNPEGIAQFAKVTGADATTGQITVSPALKEAASGACGYSPLATANHEVNPLTAYLYTLRVDPGDANKTDLVRWELDPTVVDLDSTTAALTPIAETDVTIAEYVVGMDFMVLGVGAGSSPTTPTVALETGAERAAFDPSTATTASVLSNSEVESSPELARYVLYRISTRTRRAIPRRLVMPDAAINNPTSEKLFFDLGDEKVAEVRTLQGRIALPNFVLRNLQ